MRPRTAVVITTLALLCSMAGSAQKLPSNLAQAQIFVRKFYKWYVPLAKKNKSHGAEAALAQRKSSFDPALSNALEDDFDAQAKAGEIVGMDWDPFLSAQDACDAYPESTPTTKNGAILVPVFCVRNGQISPRPVVTVEMKFQRGAWIFTNFLYEQGDLVATLARLKQDREKHAQ